MHGGGSWAGYRLHDEYKATQGIDSIFLGGVVPSGLMTDPIERLPEGNEFLIKLPSNYCSRTKLDTSITERLLHDFIAEISPDVVHFHAVDTYGLRFLTAVPNIGTKRPLTVFTLHNYMPICLNNGWMVRPDDLGLCVSASTEGCHCCFPALTRREIEIHKELSLRYVLDPDVLVSPSNFAKERYVAWGVPSNKIRIIPNGQKRVKPLPRRADWADGKLRLGYFGQIGIHKGLDVLLHAMTLLPHSLIDNRVISLDIFGSNLTDAPDSGPQYMTNLISAEYRSSLESLMDVLGASVRFHGPYLYDQLGLHMSGVDWVVVPSIQWENQPLTIQEAFSFGRPVICSGIGGMAELVSDGVNGLLSVPGDAERLAKQILFAYEHLESWNDYAERIVPPVTLKETSAQHLKLYEELLNIER